MGYIDGLGGESFPRRGGTLCSVPRLAINWPVARLVRTRHQLAIPRPFSGLPPMMAADDPLGPRRHIGLFGGIFLRVAFLLEIYRLGDERSGLAARRARQVRHAGSKEAVAAAAASIISKSCVSHYSIPRDTVLAKPSYSGGTAAPRRFSNLPCGSNPQGCSLWAGSRRASLLAIFIRDAADLVPFFILTDRSGSFAIRHEMNTNLRGVARWHRPE
jgi:hypothetical protein